MQTELQARTWVWTIPMVRTCLLPILRASRPPGNQFSKLPGAGNRSDSPPRPQSIPVMVPEVSQWQWRQSSTGIYLVHTFNTHSVSHLYTGTYTITVALIQAHTDTYNLSHSHPLSFIPTHTSIVLHTHRASTFSQLHTQTHSTPSSHSHSHIVSHIHTYFPQMPSQLIHPAHSSQVFWLFIKLGDKASPRLSTSDFFLYKYKGSQILAPPTCLRPWGREAAELRPLLSVVYWSSATMWHPLILPLPLRGGAWPWKMSSILPFPLMTAEICIKWSSPRFLQL